MASPLSNPVIPPDMGAAMGRGAAEGAGADLAAGPGADVANPGRGAAPEDGGAM
jgi:hypothetical protein